MDLQKKIESLQKDLADGKITGEEFATKANGKQAAANESFKNATNSVLGSILKNIESKMNSSNIENDANDRAARREPLKYANNANPIMYNGQQLLPRKKL